MTDIAPENIAGETVVVDALTDYDPQIRFLWGLTKRKSPETLQRFTVPRAVMERYVAAIEVFLDAEAEMEALRIKALPAWPPKR